MRVTVRCSVEVEVDVNALDDIEFTIEENSCPGTGIVGAALQAAIERDEAKRVCWACNLKGKNEIIAVDGKPYERPDR